jgi:hypothetical protein
MVFKIILIKLHLHSTNSNKHLHLHIQSLIIRRQTVFHQPLLLLLLLLLLFHLLLFILQKIIFLFLIFNISERKTLCQISHCLVMISVRIVFEKNKQSSDIFHSCMFCFFPYLSLYFSFLFVQNSDSHSHLHYLTVCNRTIFQKSTHRMCGIYIK